MKTRITTCISLTCLLALSAGALTLDVQSFRDGNIPLGYVNVADGVDPGEAINVSEPPFVDYLIPANSGSPGITAQKTDGAFIVESTVTGLEGANSLTNPDTYQVVFAWSDGIPLPFGQDYFGVSWGGWSNAETRTLITRVDLASDEEVTVYHWFNDGWDYSGHESLDGHNLKVTHHAADGSVIAEELAVLPSGGAEALFGDHRQFYSSVIRATRTAAGDYLIIDNTAANVGYKGTAVALEGGGGGGPAFELTVIGDWNQYLEPPLGWVHGHDAAWGWSLFLGHVHVANFPYLYHPGLGWMEQVAGDATGVWAYLFEAAEFRFFRHFPR
jgi:hypothetical protein